MGLIIPDIRNPHFWEIAAGIEREVRAAGYHLLLSSTDLDPEYGRDVFKDLSHRRIDGLILMKPLISQSEEDQKSSAQLLKQRLPIVEMSDHYTADYEVDRVVSDYRAATLEIISYLLSLQHRRIGMIYGVAAVELGEDRLLPFQHSLQVAGLPVDQEMIVNCGPTIEDGYQAALQLLNLPARPTALIAINDLLAIGALRASGDLGLHVPTDVSLVSYDDITLAQYQMPRLTTVSKDVVGAARASVQMLLARLREPGRPYQRINMPTRLIIRESTGPAPVK
jgi:LacI family transcriptional regulator